MSEGEKRSRKPPHECDTELEAIQAEWRKFNENLDSRGQVTRKAPPKGSKKGSQKGQGGPDNKDCCYGGVRQRKGGKWVAEIRQPRNVIKSHHREKGDGFGFVLFNAAVEAALAYDAAAKALYGPVARLNFPEHTSPTDHYQALVSKDEDTDVQNSYRLHSIEQHLMSDSEVLAGYNVHDSNTYYELQACLSKDEVTDVQNSYQFHSIEQHLMSDSEVLAGYNVHDSNTYYELQACLSKDEVTDVQNSNN
ncbi:Dehydration-responsive element-binding protein 2C [Morella rubra]|uniref:Dehydration-responsive element-binding protein 2C n=1 Tax=Morella rubra TaxID=262757 RepID=A0A6A1UG31_9ROSI|nr:Dehydration-responsive element-binding protein 2C [Morella rubra]